MKSILLLDLLISFNVLRQSLPIFHSSSTIALLWHLGNLDQWQLVYTAPLGEGIEVQLILLDLWVSFNLLKLLFI